MSIATCASVYPHKGITILNLGYRRIEHVAIKPVARVVLSKPNGTLY